jgi:hypothetical protein
LVTAVYYFYQYALRSAPGVMMPELAEAFGLARWASGRWSGCSTSATRRSVWSPAWRSIGSGRAAWCRSAPALVGAGALLFGLGDARAASVGRFVQGAGGVFALVGAVYIVGKSFPPSSAATLIGATQMFGMAGGSAGQFVVGPLIAAGMPWSQFWVGMGIAGIALSVLLFALLPSAASGGARSDWLREALRALGAVFRNPQSLLCGAVAGLLFIPTTIFDMIWGSVICRKRTVTSTGRR